MDRPFEGGCYLDTVGEVLTADRAFKSSRQTTIGYTLKGSQTPPARVWLWCKVLDLNKAVRKTGWTSIPGQRTNVISADW